MSSVSIWEHMLYNGNTLFFCKNKVCKTFPKTSNMRRTLGGNKIVDHSDVAGASPVGAAPTTYSFST